MTAIGGAAALAMIARGRGEPINSLWLIAAAVCTYALAYRFYSAFIAARVMALDDRRATPAERLRNGHDFEPTNRWIVFGHHFAAIAGPGPLVWSGAGGAIRLPARHALDHRGLRDGRGGAGLRDSVCVSAARREIAG